MILVSSATLIYFLKKQFYEYNMGLIFSPSNNTLFPYRIDIFTFLMFLPEREDFYKYRAELKYKQVF